MGSIFVSLLNVGQPHGSVAACRRSRFGTECKGNTAARFDVSKLMMSDDDGFCNRARRLGDGSAGNRGTRSPRETTGYAFFVVVELGCGLVVAKPGSYGRHAKVLEDAVPDHGDDRVRSCRCSKRDAGSGQQEGRKGR